jgi:hypothetical protein
MGERVDELPLSKIELEGVLLPRSLSPLGPGARVEKRWRAAGLRRSPATTPRGIARLLAPILRADASRSVQRCSRKRPRKTGGRGTILLKSQKKNADMYCTNIFTTLAANS